MLCARFNFAWLAIVGLLLSSISLKPVSAISQNRNDKLTREDIIALDQEVTQFYSDSYETLDHSNSSYDEQILRSIRAIRHTMVLNQFDYLYTSNETVEQSAGGQVNEAECIKQLGALARMADNLAESRQRSGLDSLPLSAIDFLESNGRTESGILNGNFIWWGSYSSCSHARIPLHLGRDYYLRPEEGAEIRGRYCVAHMKAVTWPQFDAHFEDRLSIRLGVCLPQVCHTNLYLRSEKIRDQVDLLARRHLVAPFNSHRYKITYLYCLPDEDSAYRQLDLGSKLFVCFLALWLLLLLYTNIRYHQRLETMRQLRESIDIRMIINKKREEFAADAESSSNKDEDEESTIRIDSREVIEAAAKRQRLDKGGIDFFKALSLRSNLDYLFKTRAYQLEAKRDGASPKIESKTGVNYKRTSQVNDLRGAISRRGSSSNEALIKDLKLGEGSKTKVELVPGDISQQAAQVSDQKRRSSDRTASELARANQRRPQVDIDIFDGIKVIATSWIVFGHTMMFMFNVVADLRFGAERMMDLTMLATINTLQVVGLFYVITGVLLTYLAFSRQRRRQLLRPSFWILVIVGRYIRLIPTYFLVFWFARHVSPYLGEGPFWLDYRTDVENPRGFCATESWLTMLTMSAADIKITFDCVPQSWYLSNDFRTLLVIPIYIVLLALNTLAGYAAIFATFVYSAIRMVSILRTANIDYMIILQWKPHVYSLMADRLHNVYTDLPVRLSTYLLGVIVGHLIYLYEIRSIENWPNWFRRFGVKFALVCASLTFLGAPILNSKLVRQFLPAHEDINSDLVVILIPVFKSLMEICMCIILLLLATGAGTRWIRELLTSRTAKVLSNISYAVFLVHIEIIYKLPAQKLESSYWFLFTFATFIIALSNLVAFLIHLFYEMPINNMLRHLFKWLLKTVVG